ncbi:MAG: hypothetical protein FJ313_04430 [Gemmatimonadetes bacterium]|nr:hypothetical protein [Gemmatimonadota bacterium]
MANIARVEVLFKSPGPQPNGLQAAPDGLWCIDQGDNRVYRLDYGTGRTLFEAQTTTDRSSGITVGGGFLWVASTYNARIARLDIDTAETMEEYDCPGKGIVAWRDPAEDARVTGAHGLEWRDGLLYVASPPSQHVHVMDVATWRCLREFRAPGIRVHGLAWADDGTLWAADTTAGTVSRLDTRDGRVLDAFRVEAPAEVHGLTMHEGVLWYCDAHTCDIGRLII